MNSYNFRRMVTGYISVLLLIVLVSVKGYAQASKIEWGQEFEDNASVKPVFLKQDAEGVSYWLTPRNGRLFITAFNNDYVKIQTWPLRLPYYVGMDVNKLYFSHSIVIKNKLLFLMHYIDDGSGQEEQLIVQGNIDDGEASAKLIHVARFNAYTTNGRVIDDLLLTPNSDKFTVMLASELPLRGWQRHCLFCRVTLCTVQAVMETKSLLKVPASWATASLSSLDMPAK